MTSGAPRGPEDLRYELFVDLSGGPERVNRSRQRPSSNSPLPKTMLEVGNWELADSLRRCEGPPAELAKYRTEAIEYLGRHVNRAHDA